MYIVYFMRAGLKMDRSFKEDAADLKVVRRLDRIERTINKLGE